MLCKVRLWYCIIEVTEHDCSYPDFLCEVEHILSVQEKQLKKRMRAEMPRRTSDRIAIKAAIKEEEVTIMYLT